MNAEIWDGLMAKISNPNTYTTVRSIKNTSRLEFSVEEFSRKAYAGPHLMYRGTPWLVLEKKLSGERSPHENTKNLLSKLDRRKITYPKGINRTKTPLPLKQTSSSQKLSNLCLDTKALEKPPLVEQNGTSWNALSALKCSKNSDAGTPKKTKKRQDFLRHLR